MTRNQKRGLLVTAEQFAGGAKERTPVDTGNLKASIEPNKKIENTSTGFQTEVPAKANYAGFIEFGTVKVAPSAMYRKTQEEDRGSLLKTMGTLSKIC